MEALGPAALRPIYLTCKTTLLGIVKLNVRDLLGLEKCLQRHFGRRSINDICLQHHMFCIVSPHGNEQARSVGRQHILR